MRTLILWFIGFILIGIGAELSMIRLALNKIAAVHANCEAAHE